jgi:hypothetical protein
VQRVSGICHRRIDALRMSHLMLLWARAQTAFVLAPTAQLASSR